MKDICTRVQNIKRIKQMELGNNSVDSAKKISQILPMAISEKSGHSSLPTLQDLIEANASEKSIKIDNDIIQQHINLDKLNLNLSLTKQKNVPFFPKRKIAKMNYKGKMIPFKATRLSNIEGSRPSIGSKMYYSRREEMLGGHKALSHTGTIRFCYHFRYQ